jgi:V/A-type H+-transporting ATPase subunit I
MALFADLGLDLDLLWGYDSLDVLVGEGNPTQIEQSLASEDVENFEVFSGTNSVAAFADMAADADIDDALVGVPFTAYEVPEETGDPASNVEELERKHQQIEAELGKVENELEALKHDSKAFLVALERQLTVDVQKAEAPLRFATTARSFIVEGWISSSRVSDLEAALQDAVGNRVDVDERETAEYNDHGHAEHTDHHDEELTADGGEPVASEGSYEPPVVQDNPDTAKPFESLVTMINRPNYDELDPTFIVFLTYPLAFGFMIGDMGYGLMYMLMGYGMYKAFDSEVIKSLGVIGIWAGLFTVVFGYLYDDIFGVHTSELGIEWLPLAGSFHKGLSPVHLDWALLWIVISIVFGVLHLNLGFVLGFINDRSHGIWEAFTENLSWLVMVNGFFVWLFSEHLVGQKPEFIVGDASALEHFFGFTGLPEVVGLVGLGGFAVGIGLALIGEGGLALIETVTVTLANTLSYLRLVAVLLAKAGMAFVVNLLVFGAYSETKSQNGEEVEKIIFNLPTEDVSGLSQEFVGLAHIDPVFVGIPAALLIFVFGHILVLLLGITAAGIQMLRLEYVEFFGKFYEGGGEKFQPFGRQRTHTEDNS